MSTAAIDARRELVRGLLDARLAAELARRAVVVVAGGTSGEREVSLASGRGALAALREPAAGATGAAGAPRAALGVEIDAAGRWIVGGRALDPARALAELPEDAVFFLALHGGEGENGVVQGFLEHARRAYTGSGVAASALCMDKQATRARLVEAGLTVAPGFVVDARDALEPVRVLERTRALGAGGWFVKPASGGSSVATRFVDAAGAADDGGGTALLDAVREALSVDDRALVEARIDGVEATCAVLGAAYDVRPDALVALPPVEIVPHAGRFFDYAEKYSAAGADERCPPVLLDAATSARLEALALAAHRALGCDGASRTDFIVPRPADGAAASFGEPVALETNTLPGLTERSLLPRAAAAAGLDYRSLCVALCLMALAAHERRNQETST